jgi:rubrerythrin
MTDRGTARNAEETRGAARDAEDAHRTAFADQGLGGDPACWLNRVCDACGRFVEDPLADACPACGAPRDT